MLFGDRLVVVRGGGDLGTGAVARLRRAGFPVVVLELAAPLTVRRTVAVSSAVADGEVQVEDVVARRAESVREALALAGEGVVAVLAVPQLPHFPSSVEVLVDARMAKRNLDTSPDQASLVVALGPGFVAGEDCDAVIETMRGHHLGRVIWQGAAAPDTGIPGVVGGQSARRVVRSPVPGTVAWGAAIGDMVAEAQPLGRVGDTEVTAPIAGVVRGLIAAGSLATAGLKIGDIDPRADRAACFEISDKALAVGGGVLEAVLTHLNRTA